MIPTLSFFTGAVAILFEVAALVAEVVVGFKFLTVLLLWICVLWLWGTIGLVRAGL